MKKDHILIIRFSALGDVAMLVPVVYSLAHQYPDVRITVLSRSYARPFFDGLAPNVGFMEADLKREYHGIKGLNALFRRLAAKQFTHVADMHSVLRSEFLRMRFNLGSYKVAHINKHRKGRKRLTASVNKQLIQQPTPFQNYADVLARTLNTQLNIGIAPFAAHEGKIYPPQLMQQVIEQLTKKYPEANIFLFGKGEREDKQFTEWCSLYKQCVYVKQHLETIKQELILMSHLDVMLSMDSANMHLASLVATPVVSVWGATHPYAGFMGWNQGTENAIQVPLPCRPCSIYGQKPCRRGDYACMNRIAPSTIVEHVVQIISNKNV